MTHWASFVNLNYLFLLAVGICPGRDGYRRVYNYTVPRLDWLDGMTCQQALDTDYAHRQYAYTFVTRCKQLMADQYDRHVYIDGTDGALVYTNPRVMMTSCQQSSDGSTSWTELSVCCHRK